METRLQDLRNNIDSYYKAIMEIFEIYDRYGTTVTFSIGYYNQIDGMIEECQILKRMMGESGGHQSVKSE